MLRQITLAAVLAMPVAGMGLLAGCDREMSSEKSVDVKDDGTKVTTEEKTTKDDEGNVTKTEEKKVDHPDN